jgi:hypothetical protein
MASAVAVATRDGAIPGGYRHIGAPTLYRPEYAQAIVDYFESAQLPGDLAPDDAGPGSAKRYA